MINVFFASLEFTEVCWARDAICLGEGSRGPEDGNIGLGLGAGLFCRVTFIVHRAGFRNSGSILCGELISTRDYRLACSFPSAVHLGCAYFDVAVWHTCVENCGVFLGRCPFHHGTS